MPRPQKTVPSAKTRAALQSGGRGEGRTAVGSSIEVMSQRRDPGRPRGARQQRPEGEPPNPAKIRAAVLLSTRPRWNFTLFQRLRNMAGKIAAARQTG